MKPTSDEMLRLSTYHHPALAAVLGRFGLQIEISQDGQPIPGSYWGDEEAGLIGQRLIARTDTPLHSVLHESCHYICMDSQRRAAIDTDSGGDYDEENAVCYLQILLADALPDYGRARMFEDMDTWGYSFRLGSAKKWFEQDADDARRWLLHHGLITSSELPTYQLRNH